MTHPPKPPAPRIRNQSTQALNRRESCWQIFLPLGVAVVVAITLMVLVVIGTAAPVHTAALADVSVMFLILIAGAGGAVIAAILFGMSFGVGYALRELPYLFKRAQDFAALVTHHTQRVAAPLNESVLSARSGAAAARQVVTRIRALLAAGR